jgi:protein gp37
MSDRSKITWTDATWNPVRGCTKVSAGCVNCYAERFAKRWRGIKGHPFEQGFDVRLVPEALELPLRWRKPRRVFVNSMSDLFHEKVPDEFIHRVFAKMALAERHTFQILTKRPERMRRFFEGWMRPPLPNVWIGVTAEDQRAADERIPLLLRTPAAVRFVSVEPMLSAVDLSAFFGGPYIGIPGDVVHNAYNFGLSWIIIGGESGPKARPFRIEWARALLAQCRAAGVPAFFKQTGARPVGWPRPNDDAGRDPDQWPSELRVQEFPAVRP